MPEPLSNEDIFAGWRSLRRIGGPGHNIFEVPSLEGERVDLGPEFKHLILKYGRPGVIRGRDTGVAYQEVRQFDFANWPEMSERERKKMLSLVHTPQWVMISASGMKAAQPVTGKWVRRGDKQFDRLSKLPVVGTVNEET